MSVRWPLTGRDAESGIIADLLVGDDYRGVAVTGQPGVGTSRLVRDAADRASGLGWVVRSVTATATGSTVPLGAFGSWITEFDGPAVGLARRVADALHGEGGSRLLLVVDRADLLDDLSAHVVHQLVVDQRATAMLTLRSGGRAPDAITALWKDGWLRRLELAALPRADFLDLLHHALGAAPDPDCAERMWRLTRGNTLYLRHLVEQEQSAGRLVHQAGRCRWLGPSAMSASFVDLVESHIGAVPEQIRDVVDLVAVAAPVEWDCLAALADPRALEEAEQRGLIRTGSDAVHSGHPLYAEIRLQRCGPMRLRRLRGVVAQAMTSSTGTADCVRRGVLWLESDLPADPEVLHAAAEAARSFMDFSLAERLSEAAEASGNGVGARVARAYSLLMLQKGDDASAVIDGIAGDQVPATSFINDVILRAANLLWSKRSPEESWRVIDDALVSATGPRLSQLLAFRANQLALAGRPVEVLEVLESVDYSVLDGFGTTIALCAETLALGERGRPDQACTRATTCYEVVDTTVEGRFLRQPLVEFHSFALLISGRIRDALEITRAHCHREAGQPATAQAMAEAMLGVASLAAGDLTAALRHLPESDSAVESDFVLANSFHRFQLIRVQALARSGDVDTAERTLRNARRFRHPAYVYVQSTELMAEAWVAAVQRRVDNARRLAREAAEMARTLGQLAREVYCLQTATQFGDTLTASRLTELAEAVDGSRALLAARYARALAAGDADDLAIVSVAFESMGDVLAAADASGQAAVAYHLNDCKGSAMTAAARCERLAQQCGGAVSPAIVAARPAASLTARERQIAVLVAQGLSNQQIAASVSLSVRTVEGHIYRATIKAGVAGRSDLARIIGHAH